MTQEEIREYVKKCSYADKSIDTMHTCKLEFHYRKICPSPKCICAEKFGLAESEENMSELEPYLEDTRPTLDELCDEYKECTEDCPMWKFCKAESEDNKCSEL